MENQNPQNQNTGNSLLDQIIATSRENANAQIPNNPTPMGATPPPQGGNNPNNQPPRDPVKMGTILKFIGTLFLVGLIFMGIFLAYVVFNPQQAGFFNTVFGINPEDIANLLKVLIYASFGAISFVLAIVFVVSLFRAIWTKKEQKRTKITLGLLSVFTGIMLLLTLTLWAILFEKIGKTNFSNVDGNIIVYDNDMFLDESLRESARLRTLNNIIGPITLRYKIDENAAFVARQLGGNILGYEIKFDGAECSSGTDVVTGSNPATEEAIVCTFNRVKSYKPEGFYTVQTYEGEQKITIPLSSVEVKGLVKITEEENKDGELRRFFDAQAIKNLGTARWYYLDGTNEEKKTDIFSVGLSDTTSIVALKVFNSNNLLGTYDRVFVVKNNTAQASGQIISKQNVANPQEYNFSIANSNINQGDILSTSWLVNDNVICNEIRESSCNYLFTGQGRYKITAHINLIGNKRITISDNIQIFEALRIDRHLKVMNRTGKLLNEEDTLDQKTRTFIIRDVVPPETIVFDARDVISNNPGYLLKEVKWSINDGRTTENRIGERIEFSVKRTARYNITAEYTFEKSIKTGQADDIRTATDNIMLDLERKNLTPILKISKNSDYVPARVTVDASESLAEYSEIIKFIYDFGEGRPAAEGDAIQTYQYTTPGEKTISVTIVDSNGEQATTKQTVVLKDTPKNLNFTTSLSPGIINQTIDFKADGTTGQVEDYLWNFGDNTPISHGYETSHTFTKSGEYKVTLTVRYMDGTERSTNQIFKVVDSLE